MQLSCYLPWGCGEAGTSPCLQCCVSKRRLSSPGTFLSRLPLPRHSQLCREGPHSVHSFRREGSDSTSGIPVPWWGGGSSHPCCHGPNSPTVLAAAPSPAGHQLCGLAAVDDAVWGHCYTPELLLPVWWLASVKFARPQPSSLKPHRALLRGSLSCVG